MRTRRDSDSISHTLRIGNSFLCTPNTRGKEIRPNQNNALCSLYLERLEGFFARLALLTQIVGRLRNFSEVRNKLQTDSATSSSSLIMAMDRMFIACTSPVDLESVGKSLSESERIG